MLQWLQHWMIWPCLGMVWDLSVLHSFCQAESFVLASRIFPVGRQAFATLGSSLPLDELSSAAPNHRCLITTVEPGLE